MFKQSIVGAVLLAAACSSNPAPASMDDSDRVNIGYGEQDRRQVGGAVTTISEKELDRHVTRSMENLIRSRVPGAQIVRTRDGFSVRLRGISSIHGSNEALIVIDGMPLSDASGASALATLRPEDVAKIDVLKDGMAAIYGIRGSNGVIIIETRRGR